MLAFITVVSSALALASSVTADFIPAGSAAHFFSTQNSSLVFAPLAAASGAILVAALPGDGSSDDITALYPLDGSGVPTQIAYGDFCITANGVVPESSSQVLYVAECDSTDPAQFWTLNADPPTVSNADGNCITLGRPANGVSVVLDFCNDVLENKQLWIPKPISA
ncbi:hypothetical protein PYCCODRAFT_1444242 [Trametes coccinea BRFM310]|uniref:Ricin B lectin domain-containing protein n=1 Tax=Trametes coccinea (strain BRFM310) TaxID=1353009 RepID=A0A1Y2ISP6_TRAC3|nr:hypothetical protein PYCCODRAFT_1444242 [Trametes coccinea BRFM310]